jgi:hypothetical protein
MSVIQMIVLYFDNEVVIYKSVGTSYLYWVLKFISLFALFIPMFMLTSSLYPYLWGSKNGNSIDVSSMKMYRNILYVFLVFNVIENLFMFRMVNA